jgi:hypothetical protein
MKNGCLFLIRLPREDIIGDLITGGILLYIAGVGFLIIYIGLRKGFD